MLCVCLLTRPKDSQRQLPYHNVGISVCGASAATAVQSAIHASKDDLAAVVTVITLFTVAQMIALPYLIQALDLPSKVAGAWIGGSIDATGGSWKVLLICNPSAIGLSGFIIDYIIIYYYYIGSIGCCSLNIYYVGK